VQCGHGIICVLCRQVRPFHIGSLDVAIRPDSYALAIDPAASLNNVWYHGTGSVNWLDDVFRNVRATRGVHSENPVLVHVGTLQAAQERNGITQERHGRTHGAYLYKVTCRKGTIIEDRIANDITEFPRTVEEISQSTTANVVRYINRWESPGSVSLLADPRFLVAERIS
jgi:hypothetical protein